MLSCISFVDFIPVEWRNRRVSECSRLCNYKTGERYAEATVEVGPGTSGPIGPAGLRNFMEAP
jgi:hypothetical protein